MAQKIKIERGKTAVFSLEIIDEDTGNQYSLESGEILRFGVKKSTDDAEYLIEKELTSADEEQDGSYTVAIDPDDTIDLATGTFHYDVGLQSGSDYWSVIPYSDFVIGPNATVKE